MAVDGGPSTPVAPEDDLPGHDRRSEYIACGSQRHRCRIHWRSGVSRSGKKNDLEPKEIHTLYKGWIYDVAERMKTLPTEIRAMAASDLQELSVSITAAEERAYHLKDRTPR